MRRLPLYVLVLFIASACSKHQRYDSNKQAQNNSLHVDSLSSPRQQNRVGDGALLLSSFSSYAELKDVITISYSDGRVSLTYKNGSYEVISILNKGVDQNDFARAQKGNAWKKLMLALKCPFAAIHKNDLQRIENLGRRKIQYGKRDVAFYDLAETMVFNIADEDTLRMSDADLSEKGYLNTFNHITAQSLMTSMFSEPVADFVADVHERYNLPELITGNFTDIQLADMNEGPVDNYIDMINNECGQELGKVLRAKYHINRHTYWSPGLLADYLNDVQSYNSWCFQIAFKPFRPADEIVIRFAKKINIVISAGR